MKVFFGSFYVLVQPDNGKAILYPKDADAHNESRCLSDICTDEELDHIDMEGELGENN